MAESVGTVTIRGQAFTIVTPTYEVTINTLPKTPSSPEASIDFNPKGDPFIYLAGTFTYIPQGAYYVPTGIATTFTATYRPIDATRYAIEYLWDFGDGIVGYGTPITHTYKVGSPDTQVSVQITDNRNTVVTASRQIYTKDFLLATVGRPTVLMGT